jgi:hypothetical protein
VRKNHRINPQGVGLGNVSCVETNEKEKATMEGDKKLVL